MSDRHGLHFRRDLSHLQNDGQICLCNVEVRPRADQYPVHLTPCTDRDHNNHHATPDPLHPRKTEFSFP
jgi:hypothetical protein